MKNITIVPLVFFILSGCASLLGGLRQDFDDQYYNYDSEPTSGGRFASGGLLEERGPASDLRASSPGTMGAQGSWLSTGTDARQRQFTSRPIMDESGRTVPSYAANPSLPPEAKRRYKNGDRATRADFIDDDRQDGSLWTSDGQTNYYLTKNKVRGEGDLITIVSDEDLVKDIAAEIKRTMSLEERERELELSQETLRRKMLGLPDDPLQQYASGAATGDNVNSSNAAAERAPAAAGTPAEGAAAEKEIEVPRLKWADIDLRKNMDLKNGDVVMGEVIERYPNGNVKVRGVKKVRYRRSTRLVSVIGIARGSDISDDDKLEAAKLYEYRLETLR